MLPSTELSTTILTAPWVEPYWYPRMIPTIDYEMGGVALSDASQGLNVQVWKCYYDADTQTIYVGLKEDGPFTAVLTGLADIEEVTFTFDQNMHAVIAYKQAGVVKLYWYDSSIPGWTTNTYINASSAIIRLDDKRSTQLATSDMLLITIEGGYICLRQQRERFETLYQLKATSETRLAQCGMNIKWRFQIQTSGDHPECVNVGGKVSAACIVADQCSRVNAPYDVGDLYDTFLLGYLINKQGSARSNIEPLQAVYLFNIFEDDKRIWFRNRGRLPVATYTSEDIAAHTSDGDIPEILPIHRSQEIDLPKSVTIGYADIDLQHEPNTQDARRLTSNAKGELTLNVPIVMTANEAKRTAERLLRAAWLNRESTSFSLPASEIFLKPTDSVVVTDNGVENTIRISSISYQMPGILQCEGSIDSLEGTLDYDAYVNYESTALGVPGSYTPSSVPTAIAPVVGYWLDIPTYNDTHSSGGVYIAIGSSGDFRGGYLYTSQDGGVTYQYAAVTDRAIVGESTTALGAPIHQGIADWGHTVRVSLLNSTDMLYSIDPDTALSHSSNLALLGDEIICFEYATLVSAGVFDITGIHRGLCGTEQACSTHTSSDRFVMLNGAIKRIEISDSKLHSSALVKFLAYAQYLDEVSAQTMVYEGIAYKPYAPCDVYIENLGGGSYQVYWTRRTRIDGEWRDLVDVALSEATEKYRVSVYDGSSLLSTSEVYTPTATVSASSGNTITINQISAVIGAGSTSEVTVP